MRTLYSHVDACYHEHISPLEALSVIFSKQKQEPTLKFSIAVIVFFILLSTSILHPF